MSNDSSNENVCILIEILNGKDLLIGDSKTSDPYVKIKMGKNDLHATKHILKTLNPVYTSEHDNSYILYCTKKKLSIHSDAAITFKIKDWDRFGTNDDIGHVDITEEEINSITNNVVVEQPITKSYTIIPPPNRENDHKDHHGGTLTIRFKIPKESDVKNATHRSNVEKAKIVSMLKEQQQKQLAQTTTTATTATTEKPVETPTTTEIDTDANKGSVEGKVTEAVEKKPTDVKVPTDSSASIKGATESKKTNANANANANAETVPKRIKLKIEIMECNNILIGDKISSDPYVKIRLGGSQDKDLHTTKHVRKTLNPRFTAALDNAYHLDITEKELHDHNGLIFLVKDWDLIGHNDELGFASMPAALVMAVGNDTESREMEFNFQVPKNKEKNDCGGLGGGTITVCFTSEIAAATKKKKQEQMIAEQSTKVEEVAAAIGASSKDAIPDLVESAREYTPLIEIVSCRDLLIGDPISKSSDPYVKAKMGKTDLHYTKHVLKDLNPVYTKAEDNKFSLRESKEKVYAQKFITFKIKDWDALGSNDDLGSVQVPADFFYKDHQNEKTQEFKIIAPLFKKKEAGYITIKCRPTTNEDEEEFYNKTDRKSNNQSLFGKMLKKKETVKDYGPPDLHFLIEIVSCDGLFGADGENTSDPYVRVKLGKKDVHQTLPKNKTVSPIYTIASKSLFILDVATQELIDCRGLFFAVWDKDLMSHDDELGYALVSAKTILQSIGERTEFRLKIPKEFESKKGDKVDAGYVCLRIRHATQYDRDFLKRAETKDLHKFLDVHQLCSSIDASRVTKIGLPRKKKDKNKIFDKEGLTKFLTRPCADPQNPDETKYMYEDEIESECWKPSRNWVEAGSGDLGRIYLEIIGANGLPNLDRGETNKTDPFLAVVYEDVVVRTEEIDNCLSPRFLPWTRRAFKLHMANCSSSVHIGVFDSDNDGKSHDFIGQTSIELSNLFPNTEYTLEYDLFKNKNSDRTPLGAVTVRLRFEIEDPKKLVMSNLQMPPDVYVCANRSADFEMIQKTINGEDSMLEYGGAAFFTKAMAELSSYMDCQVFVVDAVISLVFWRGQVPLPVLGYDIPLHSFILFYMATTLVENWGLYPSYFFFSISWLLLSIQIHNNCYRINPWTKKKSFLRILSMLVLGKGGVDNIPVKYLAEQSDDLDESINMKISMHADVSIRQAELLKEHNEKVEKLGDQVADTDISSAQNKISFDPLKHVLFPIQLQIVPLLNYLRFARNVVLWNEPYYAFLITVVSFALGAVFWIIPWGFFVRWTSRFVAWIVLGPHMKLVDIFWYSKRVVTGEELLNQERDQLDVLFAQAKEYAKIARLQKEKAEKLRDMKGAIFGTYLSKVPLLCTELHVECPMHTSKAEPYIKSPLSENQDKSLSGLERVHGQILVGDMIPKLLTATSEEKVEVKGSNEKKND